MILTHKYMAASVPRFLRQTKLGHLPLRCLIGSTLTRGDGGNNVIYDVIMLPVNEFHRMKINMGLHHVLAPSLQMDATFQPAFVMSDMKQLTVPADETDPEAYARAYFIKEFKLTAPTASTGPVPSNISPFLAAAISCLRRVMRR